MSLRLNFKIPYELTRKNQKKFGIQEACITGSVLVPHADPQDIDYCLLFSNKAAMHAFLSTFHEAAMSYDGAGMFEVCRRDQYNFICTDQVSLYWRTVAFSGVLSEFHLACDTKELRVAFAKACMDWDARLMPIAGLDAVFCPEAYEEE